jgi:hypothetical protein
VENGVFANLHLDTNTVKPNLSLVELFNLHGSDKSTHHDYGDFYETILGSRFEQIETIVEIGIGTNNLTIPQNMGLGGKPGASLRAFRDWARRSSVIGADIDKECLFEEDRIKTVFLDQLDISTFGPIKKLITNGADLIVIDGLHTPEADINSVWQLLPHLRINGYLVVEDIAPKAFVLLWPFVGFFLNSNFKSTLTKRKNGGVFYIHRLA